MYFTVSLCVVHFNLNVHSIKILENMHNIYTYTRTERRTDAPTDWRTQTNIPKHIKHTYAIHLKIRLKCNIHVNSIDIYYFIFIIMHNGNTGSQQYLFYKTWLYIHRLRWSNSKSILALGICTTIFLYLKTVL